MQRFLDLAVRYEVPVIIHYEIDDESLPSLNKMLEANRDCVIILAHNGGRADISTLSLLLNDYPNVLVDWAGMTRFGAYGRVLSSNEDYTWYVKNPIEDGIGHLRPEWKAFAEKYQDRIVGIGFDGAHPELNRTPEVYMKTMVTFRSMLSDLSPMAAEKIASKNAQRVFRVTVVK